MKLLLGPIVGAVSDREARIWLRADERLVDLAYGPDRYRITLKLCDETGTERVTYALPG